MADPRDYSAAEALKDGTALRIRALRPDDRERMAAAVGGLDGTSIYLRLFSHRRELTERGLDRLMQFDPAREVVLLATIDDGGRETIIGSARYVVGAPGAAEIAFVVEEDFHGRGVAGRLLRHLANVAVDQGIGTFEADVLAGNGPMRAVFTRAGWPQRTRHEGDSVHITMELPSRTR